MVDEFAAEIDIGHDVLLALGEPDERPMNIRSFASALGRLVSMRAAKIGALVATGGETARAALDEIGVTSLTLEGEFEDGVVCATAQGIWRGIVVTKSGGFGDTDTLLRIHHMLAARRTLNS